MTATLRISLYAWLTAISLLLPQCAAAEGNRVQENERDSIQLFRGVAVSYDLAGTVMRMVSDYGQSEAALRVNLLDRYFPTIEAGLGSANHEPDIVTQIGAKVNAPYFRLGCDLNMAKNKHDIYRVLVGARYGFTSFKTEAEGIINVPYWGGTVPYSVTTERCAYHWAELLFAVDAYIWGPLRLGWSFRYRMKLAQSDMGANSLWYIPGFGENGNKLGGTFNIIFELGRKNKKTL